MYSDIVPVFANCQRIASSAALLLPALIVILSPLSMAQDSVVSVPTNTRSASDIAQLQELADKVEAAGRNEQAKPQNIFLIGNSLTWDTLPGLLDGNVQWHVDCGKNLKFMFENPANPCVKTSTQWPEALKSPQYDVLVVQPHFGTTLDEDVAVISHWMQMQPTANLIVHTGWNKFEDFEQHYHIDGAVERMNHSPAYFESLIAALEKKFPQRTIRSTEAIDVLDEIWHEIEQKSAPFASFEELYRDNIHMTTQAGRYLMHNLLRKKLGQLPSSQGFQIDDKLQSYLDSKLKSVKQ